ncbi:hypothetical protein HYFRA_00013836 [Hymenoscyphus fraxineus]|uniref:Uncharacterized protein n=1 Tax=Hymenoscyphus fraxineus TaxID=746836 RepID=A0A9N9LAG3_9HELO|nr:hypothetical protein HYFRA_00013836 [Hymenoscyphus fraxineus]
MSFSSIQTYGPEMSSVERIHSSPAPSGGDQQQQTPPPPRMVDIVWLTNKDLIATPQLPLDIFDTGLPPLRSAGRIDANKECVQYSIRHNCGGVIHFTNQTTVHGWNCHWGWPYEVVEDSAEPCPECKKRIDRELKEIDGMGKWKVKKVVKKVAEMFCRGCDDDDRTDMDSITG